MSVAQRERAALVATLRAVGPDAPTLCEGWTARDLAAHLVVRESRLDAAPGITIGALAGYTARVQDRVAATTPWDALLDTLASGPPWYSPLKVLDPVANAAEMFVHHEDVRRAVPGWTPRTLDAATTRALRRPLALLARLTLGRAPVRVHLCGPDATTLAVAGRGPGVTVTGEPGELLLFVFGRDQVRIDLAGDTGAVTRLRHTKRGI